MKKPVSFWAILLMPLSIIAQKQSNNWVFGNAAGLNFNNSIPAFFSSSIISEEGCSSFSDANGHLLFYSNGEKVWDRNNNVMPDGDGLLGDNAASQSALIVDIPNNKSQYYIFTLDKEAGINGLHYSVIDMAMNNGLGDVAEKNHSLLTPVCEKITAVRHKNTKDTWVITHKFGSDEFYVYLIDCNGLHTTPRIFHIGSVISRPQSVIGCMKISPDLKKLAVAVFDASVDMFDFDNATGIISNYSVIPSAPNNGCGPYGVEFSPDNKLLYVSEIYNCAGDGLGGFKLLQYDLTALAIIDSKQMIDEGTAQSPCAGLQLGPDKRIYVAYDGQPFLGVITSPNISGTGCNLTKTEIIFPAPALSRAGLPNIIAGLDSTLLGKDTSLCSDEGLTIGIDLPNTNYKWNTGSTEKFITVKQSGDYILNIGANGCTYADTISVGITIKPAPDLGPDQKICIGDQVILDPKSEDKNVFLWQDGSTAPKYIATAAGTYSVTVTNACGSGSDEIILTEGKCPLAVPNAFTPGKATNNVFRMANATRTNNFKMEIFNRWGQRVFITSDPSKGWDGNFDLKQMPEGVYVYSIRYNDIQTGKLTSWKGTVMLIR